MPRYTPCIIPYNGKVRQESLQFREPMTAGVVLFTKSSREGHDFAAIILYPMLVPNEMTYLFFLPLLFSNTHRQKTLTPTPVRVFCRLAPSSSFLHPSASLVKGRWHGRSP